MEEKRTIPEMESNTTGIVLPILDVPIVFNKETKMVKMQKITAGKRRDAMRKHINTSVIGQQMNGKIDDVLGIQISMLAKIIIDAPFDFSERGLENLPEEVIDYLYSSYESWTKKKVITEST